MSHAETPKVEIYAKYSCPYCIRAKALLDKKGVEYTEYEVTGDEDKRAEMIERSAGGRTVPQIFIGGESIGGSDELSRLDREGRLDELLGL